MRVQCFSKAALQKAECQATPVLKNPKYRNCKPFIAHCLQDIRTLASASDVQVLDAAGAPPAGAAVDIVDENIQAYLVLEGLVDAAKEIAKLAKRSEEINK